MSAPYSQFKAFTALTKAALISIGKSPTSVVFSFAFPLVFILAFSYLGKSKNVEFQLAFTPASLQYTSVMQQLEAQPNIKLKPYVDDKQTLEQLKRGQIDVVLDIDSIVTPPYYTIKIKQTILEPKEEIILQALMEQTIHPNVQSVLDTQHEPSTIDEFKNIDFILPGQLGFALLAASVFGTAFLFYNLRQQLVLKRFLATPVSKLTVIASECFARMLIQVASAVFIIGVGYFFLDYTLVDGFWTFLNMMILCIIALFTFLSYGFIISGLAKSEATIPPLANIVTLPQFILAGTFFPIENLPTFVQYISKIMPLTYFNDAMRQIAFDGASLWQVKFDILIMLIWGIVSFAIASKTFKWE